MSFYYLSLSGETIGPVTAEELSALRASGKITSTSHVIREGDKVWVTYTTYFPEAWTLPPPPNVPNNPPLIAAPTSLPSTATPPSATVGQKVAAGFFYSLALLSLIMLIKTELRKWVVMGGQPSSANTGIFWLSLGGLFLFAWLGSACTPGAQKKENGANSESS